ncbi:MAG: biotin synthase BioB [Nitrospinota bacterium]|jgi:biotin synthase|nr:biotin synthase BioB [Nitrospinota bacterium]
MNSKKQKFNIIKELESKTTESRQITFQEAVFLSNLNDQDIFDLIASANRIRVKFKGNKISLCSIVNAKSGRCPEDCVFCSQSIHFKTNIDEYPLIKSEEILEKADEALSHGAQKFGIVTSGRKLSTEQELNEICETIKKLKKEGKIHRCASLGMLGRDELLKLKEAGLEEYHHNLETSRSYFPKVCTTHDYEEDVETVRTAKSLGLRTCCGGIFGLGESMEQRIELAFTLNELNVDSVPLNFLHPIKGTKSENFPSLKPLEILKIIALYRFLLPTKDIKIAGGREHNLRDFQSMIFAAGANSTMVGNYLTTKGRAYQDDLQMIKDMGLEPV